MTGRCINWLGHTRSRSISPAVIGRAKERPTFHDLATHLHPRKARVVTLVELSTSRIDTSATGIDEFPVFQIPITGPLPNIACHVVQPIAVWWKRTDRCGPLVTIFECVLD